MKNFATKGKNTIEVFFKDFPQRIEVFNNGKLYFFRELGGKHQRIKFNVCHPGNYTISEEADTISVKPISIHPLKIKLPPPQRNEFKKFRFKKNDALKGTPARHFYQIGLIELGPEYYKQPFPIRLFIILHEIGHFFYKDENLADLYAAKLFIENGYNNSTALYSLTKVLNSQSFLNNERVMKLFKILHR